MHQITKMYLVQKILGFSPHRMTFSRYKQGHGTRDISKPMRKKSAERQRQPRDRRALEPSFLINSSRTLAKKSIFDQLMQKRVRCLHP